MGDCNCHSQDLSWEGDGLACACLELTPICNNHCGGYSNPFTDSRDDTPFSAEQWIRLIRQLRPHLGRVTLTGGEPTLHPDFVWVAAFLDYAGLPFRLLTNGRWLHPRRLVDFLRQLSSIDSLLISLHGPDALCHAGFWGMPGSFEETVHNIRPTIYRPRPLPDSSLCSE